MTQVMQFVETLPPEEVARANFYGLLARLFYGPADAPLLQAISSSTYIDAEEGGIAEAWQGLCRAAAQADPEAVRDEFDTIFVGTGKSPVTLYLCAYSIRYSNEAPLAALRGELAALGLRRREDAGEPEDHVAALCDTMRHLIAIQKRDLAVQAAFFNRWIGPAFGPLCNAIQAEPRTAFYRSVGRFTEAFLKIEQRGFEML